MDHPVYKRGMIFERDGRAVILVQKRISCKYVYWDAIDYWLANDIYEHPRFKAWFEEHASNPPMIFQVRSVMWALRMKPLPKEEWEEYF